MIILGIGGFFHDFNAGAIDTRTGRVAAAEEERFSRRKHHSIMGAPTSSVDCILSSLAQIGATPEEVDAVVLSDEQRHPLESFLRPLFPRATWHHVSHHLCHAAAAFHSSGFDRAAILCLDGYGDGLSGLLAVGDGPRIEVLHPLSVEHSIGLEYLRATCHIGLGTFGAEGKTQGLAAYGQPRFFERYMDQISLLPDGTFRLGAALRSMRDALPGEHYAEARMLGNDFLPSLVDRRFPDEELTQDHMDLAASIQEVLNVVGLHCARALLAQTGASRLVLSGGVALNSTMNGVIARDAGFTFVTAHPAASDRGNGLGAALYYLTQLLGEPSPLSAPLVYSGQQFDRNDVIRAVEAAGVPYRIESSPVRTAAELVAADRIVGWFQGRSELGARALGNRSILANPGHAANKDRLNANVKHREWFRPFAPSVVHEHAGRYFDCRGDGAYMTMTVPVREDQRQAIPAVTHGDGTARIQVVERDVNALYHDVIADVGARTGVPVVVNTSFNDNAEPIVESPTDAINCFRRTALDAVLIGDVLIEREAAGRAA